MSSSSSETDGDALTPPVLHVAQNKKADVVSESDTETDSESESEHDRDLEKGKKVSDLLSIVQWSRRMAS